MSIAGDAGALAAARDILAVVESQIADAKSEEALEKLRKVKAACEAIIRSADSGWY